MSVTRAARLSCLASNHLWRRQATVLRQHAEQRPRAGKVRATLRREADAADRQADMWLEGAMETR